MVYHTSGQGTTQSQYESIAHHAFDGSISNCRCPYLHVIN